MVSVFFLLFLVKLLVIEGFLAVERNKFALNFCYNRFSVTRAKVHIERRLSFSFIGVGCTLL